MANKDAKPTIPLTESIKVEALKDDQHTLDLEWSPELSAAGRADGHWSRRAFLSGLSVAGVSASGLLAAASPLIAEEPALGNTVANDVQLTLKINGKSYPMGNLDPRVTLLDCLRERLHLTGTKKGCDHGQCGACTVHINGRRVNSCLALAVMHGDDEITTVEGLGQPGNLHPVQAAFIEHDGYQCGYCTSGQIMSAAALLHEPIGPSDEDVKHAMSGNICRCGAYPYIVAAVQQVRTEGGRRA